MKISRIHNLFSVKYPNSITYPQRYFGVNYKTVINFWLYLDKFSLEDYRQICNKSVILPDGAYFHCFSYDEFKVNTIRQSVMDVVPFEIGCWSARGRVFYATLELLSCHKFLKNDILMSYVPLFDGL